MFNAITAQDSIESDPSYGEETNFFVLLGVASAMLSHRVSNAIGILGMQISQLEKYINGDTRSALNLVTAMRESIGTLSELSRAVEALKPDNPPLLDVNSLLYDAWEATRVRNISKPVRVSFDLPEDVPSVRAYGSLLAEAFRTVLENSLEAIDKTDKEEGHINIRSQYTYESNMVEIRIEDNGVGIPPKILSKLFQHPVPSSRLSKGIGLWLAHLTIAGIGGEISIQYTKISQGTIMRIALPAIKVTGTSADGNHD